MPKQLNLSRLGKCKQAQINDYPTPEKTNLLMCFGIYLTQKHVIIKIQLDFHQKKFMVESLNKEGIHETGNKRRNHR